MSDTFGSYIKKLRKEKRLTLVKLSELSGVSNPYLSQIENNKFIPSTDILRKLAVPLGVDYLSLLEEAGHVEQNAYINEYIPTYLENVIYNFKNSLKNLPTDIVKSMLNDFNEALLDFKKKVDNDKSNNNFSSAMNEFEKIVNEEIISGSFDNPFAQRPPLNIDETLREYNRIFYKGVRLTENEVNLIYDFMELLIKHRESD